MTPFRDVTLTAWGNTERNAPAVAECGGPPLDVVGASLRMRGVLGRLTFCTVPWLVMMLAAPAVAEPVPAPSHSVTRTCAPNRITVVEITLADYPPGSVASIEGDPIPVNATTTVYITRPIVLEVDSSGYEGDFEQRIRPRAVCRLFF